MEGFLQFCLLILIFISLLDIIFVISGQLIRSLQQVAMNIALVAYTML